jgi:hypothetical protein
LLEGHNQFSLSFLFLAFRRITRLARCSRSFVSGLGFDLLKPAHIRYPQKINPCGRRIGSTDQFQAGWEFLQHGVISLLEAHSGAAEHLNQFSFEIPQTAGAANLVNAIHVKGKKVWMTYQQRQTAPLRFTEPGLPRFWKQMPVRLLSMCNVPVALQNREDLQNFADVGKLPEFLEKALVIRVIKPFFEFFFLIPTGFHALMGSF